MPDPELRDDVDGATGEVKPPPPRFSEFLIEHKSGALDMDIQAEFDDVIDAVLRTGKAGTLDLKIKVTKSGDMMVAIVEEINSKIPELADPRLYFRGTDGRLSRDNPMAPRMLSE